MNSLKSGSGSIKRTTSLFRGSSGKFQIQYFPVYQVDFGSTFNDKVVELKDFYRSKVGNAIIQIGTNPEILREADTKYYCELFWALESESIPHMVVRQREDEAQMAIEINM